MKKILISMLLLISFIFLGCTSGKHVQKEYFTGGNLRSEFITDKKDGTSGLLKKYGHEAHITSTVQIKNSVKHGIEIGYDRKGRMLWKLNHVNGKQHGVQNAFYPNGDIMITYIYRNGMKHGPAKTYNKDGSVNRSVLYSRGKIIN